MVLIFTLHSCTNFQLLFLCGQRTERLLANRPASQPVDPLLLLLPPKSLKERRRRRRPWWWWLRLSFSCLHNCPLVLLHACSSPFVLVPPQWISPSGSNVKIELYFVKLTVRKSFVDTFSCYLLPKNTLHTLLCTNVVVVCVTTPQQQHQWSSVKYVVQ